MHYLSATRRPIDESAALFMRWWMGLRRHVTMVVSASGRQHEMSGDRTVILSSALLVALAEMRSENISYERDIEIRNSPHHRGREGLLDDF